MAEVNGARLSEPTHVHIMRDTAGNLHVQNVGPEHVVEGSLKEFTLAPGDELFIRHVPVT